MDDGEDAVAEAEVETRAKGIMNSHKLPQKHLHSPAMLPLPAPRLQHKQHNLSVVGGKGEVDRGREAEEGCPRYPVLRLEIDHLGGT